MTKILFFACIFAASFTVGNPTFAQSVNPIDYCRDNSDGKSERIECLEAAIANLMNGTTVIANETPQPLALAEENVPENTQLQSSELPTGLGAERVRLPRDLDKEAREKKLAEQTQTANVTKLVKTGRGTYIFHLDNGQVWREKGKFQSRDRFSKNKNYVVTISKSGATGGYRLKVEGKRGELSVDRIE